MLICGGFFATLRMTADGFTGYPTKPSRFLLGTLAFFAGVDYHGVWPV